MGKSKKFLDDYKKIDKINENPATKSNSKLAKS